MSSSRVILAFLGIIFLVIVVISSSRIVETIRNKTGLLTKQSQNNSVEATPTQAPAENDGDESAQTTPAAGNEIPSTGPMEITYFLLGSSLIAGIIIRKKTKPRS